MFIQKNVVSLQHKSQRKSFSHNELNILKIIIFL